MPGMQGLCPFKSPTAIKCHHTPDRITSSSWQKNLRVSPPSRPNRGDGWSIPFPGVRNHSSDLALLLLRTHSTPTIVKHIPDWFPGAGFKAWAREAHSRSEEFVNAPYQYAKKLIVSGLYIYDPFLYKQTRLQNDGQGIRSFTSESIELLERQSGRELDADEEFLVKWAGASVYAGE